MTRIARIMVPTDFSAASDAALECARAGADLTVMGTHGRTRLGHLLIGSVAEHVVRTAECPVLTTREKEAAAPTMGVLAA